MYAAITLLFSILCAIRVFGYGLTLPLWACVLLVSFALVEVGNMAADPARSDVASLIQFVVVALHLLTAAYGLGVF